MKTTVQLTRFALIGVVNTVLHLTTVGLLTQLLGLSQLISNVAAYLVASSFSFFANSIWSFRVRPQIRRFARFQMVGLMGLVASAVLGRMGDVFAWHYAMTVLLTACVVPVLSFMAHRSYTYSQ